MSEEHGSEVEIDPNIDLVDTGSKNCCNVAVTTSKSCYNTKATIFQSLIRN